MNTRTFRVAFIEEPARLAAAQPAQLGISALSMLFTAVFFAGPLLSVDWLPDWLVFVVAALAALGVEYAFLKGVADKAYAEAHGASGRAGDVLIYTTGALLIVAGTTVLLTYAYKLPWFVAPGAELAAVLSLLHIVPLAIIGVCSAQLHGAAERAGQVERRQAAQTWEQRKASIDAEVYEAEQKALARVRVRAAQVPTEQRISASGTATNTDRTVLREQVARTLREQPQANKSELARSLAIGRTTLYELINEAKQRGEL